MQILATAFGKRDIHQFSRDDLRAVTPEAAAMTGLSLAEPSLEGGRKMNRIPPSPLWTPGVLDEILRRSMPGPRREPWNRTGEETAAPSPPAHAATPPSAARWTIWSSCRRPDTLVTEPERDRCCTETDIPAGWALGPLELDLPVIVGAFRPAL